MVMFGLACGLGESGAILCTSQLHWFYKAWGAMLGTDQITPPPSPTHISGADETPWEANGGGKWLTGPCSNHGTVLCERLTLFGPASETEHSVAVARG